MALSLTLHVLLAALIAGLTSRPRHAPVPRGEPALVLRLQGLPQATTSVPPARGTDVPQATPSRDGRSAARRAMQARERTQTRTQNQAQAQAQAQAHARPGASGPSAPRAAGATVSVPAPGISTRAAIDAAVADPRWQLRQRDFPPPPDPLARAVAGSARPPCYGPSAPMRGGGLLAIPALLYDMAEGNCVR